MQQASSLPWEQPWGTTPPAYLAKAMNNPSQSPDVAQIWLHQSFRNAISSPETIDLLTAHGYTQVSSEWLWFLTSQLHDAITLISPGERRGKLWAKQSAMDFIKAYPVILGTELELSKEALDSMLQLAGVTAIPMVNPYPLPQAGQVAFVVNPDNATGPVLGGYRVTELPEAAQRRWEAIGNIIRDLSAPLLNWPEWTIYHQDTNSEASYLHSLTLVQRTLDNAAENKDTEAAAQAERQLQELIQGRNDIENLKKMWLLPDRERLWAEVQRQTQLLVQDYYQHYQTRQAEPPIIIDVPATPQSETVVEAEPKKPRAQPYPLPRLTSNHQSILPSVEHFRGLAQSFGPRVARSLWNIDPSQEPLLKAPNGSTLIVRGENGHETRALHQFLDGGMGVEGIKYMVTMLAVYHLQTAAVDRKIDARVTLRQLLEFMGRGDHADDLDEQRKLMHYILYLARTWVTAKDKEEVIQKRGRPRSIYREYTPLIVLEALGSDERGGIKIPAVVEFHLGKEFWDQMFGSKKHFFTMPTMLILNYHSKDQPQEICLAFYLANMLNLNDGVLMRHFPVLLTETGLQDQMDIDKGVNRTRAALRVLYALEQLEKDQLIKRSPHTDVDTVLAIAYYTGETAYTSGGMKLDRLSETTISRIKNFYHHLSLLTAEEQRTKKRQALQNLLERVTNNSIKFQSGSLINTQIQKRIAGRQAAIEKREQAQGAARKRKGKGDSV